MLLAWHVLLGIAAAATVASICYCILSLAAGLKFWTTQRHSNLLPDHLPPVSILKPLKGSDPELYEALRSHCVQDYSEYEVLFGVSELTDPAVATVERLIAEFPGRKLRIIECIKQLGANGKVSNLAQLVPVAAHEILLVNDSDIRVEPEYLRTIISDLQQPRVGLVTCLYRGSPAPTIGSKLEALGISTDFTPGVLVARQIEGGLHFGLGSTLAFRKRDLAAIGGFESIVDYLADDYELGRRIAQQNLRVELAHSVVETHLPAYDFAGLFHHQVRWARTIRTARPSGYAGLVLTFALPWAVMTLALAPHAPWAWALAAAALLVRLGSALVFGRLVVRDSQILSSLWLLALRDFLGFAVWLIGWAGRKVVWRGLVFEVKNGKLKPTD